MSKENTKKCTSVGGQAVIEGVMMRGKSAMATAVRDEDGIIRIESKRVKPKEKRSFISRLPIIRGVVSFVQSFTDGTQTLMSSAEVFGEGEPSKFEKWVAKKLKVDVMKVVSFIALLLGLCMAVLLFMWLPQHARELIEKLVGNGFKFDVWAKNFIEGGFKLFIFVAYILLSSILKDIRRTFMYHGAEHKTISCYESGLELTVENARKCSRVHDRCGTTFLVFVLTISILVFALFESLAGEPLKVALGDGTIEYKLVRVLCKIGFLPIVAGLSYELLKLLSMTKSVFVLPLKAPGLLLQRLTTREPDDRMLEVAIAAFKTVMEMDENPELPERKFNIPKTRNEVVAEIKEKLKINGVEEDAEAEWIIALTLKIKRDEVYTDDVIETADIKKIRKIVKERITGRPLWYCMGDTEFYGYTIKVDERVLIPRPETELLVYNALDYLDERKKVLDLCTGSGAIAIALKKEKNPIVTAVDKSMDALDLAKENAKNNDVDINFIWSDMFSALTGKKFDLIVSNPPYIKSEDIKTLQTEVKDFEPIMALDGGKDGYDFYKIIADQVKEFLNTDGVLLLECGIGQASEIAKMLTGFKSVEIIKDYEYTDRIVKAVL